MGFLNGSAGHVAAPPMPVTAPRTAGHPQDHGPYGLSTVARNIDFISAVHAHRIWKMELGKRLQLPSARTLDHRLIAQDRRSALGQWIHGEAQRQFGHLPSFEQLKATHALFHQAAGRLVQLHRAGRPAEADQLMRQGDYPRHSLKVMGLLGALHEEAARHAGTPARVGSCVAGKLDTAATRSPLTRMA